MKRRDFLKTTATLIGGAAIGGGFRPGASLADRRSGQRRHAHLGPLGDDAEPGHPPDRHRLDDPRAAECPRRDRHHRQELYRDPEPRPKLRSEPRRARLYVPLAARREVPRRQDDDLGGRQIFLRSLPRQGDRRGQFRSVQRRRRDRNARRPHRRHQDESRQRAVPEPACGKRRRRDHAAGLRRPAGQDADRRGPVQVRAARIRSRGRARAVRRLLGRACLSRPHPCARGDRTDGAADGLTHRRNAHDQRHSGRPDEGGQRRSEAQDAHLVPAQLGLRQLQSRVRAVQGCSG